MKSNNGNKIISILTVLLCLLICTASCIGILTSGFYAKESFNWQVQAKGQDIVDLFLVVPALLLTSVFTSRGKSAASLLWCGTDLYVVYTFIIYCFDIHFNQLFLVYCFTLGLSSYSFCWFLLDQVRAPKIVGIVKFLPIKVAGVYLITIAGAFCFLWLSDIIPEIINNETPGSLTALGLPTNPVHTLDLSIFLPGVFISGLLTLRKRYVGYFFTILILTFFIVMDITIAWLSLMMKQHGLESNLSVTVVMALLALLSALILIWTLRNTRFNASSDATGTVKSNFASRSMKNYDK